MIPPSPKVLLCPTQAHGWRGGAASAERRPGRCAKAARNPTQPIVHIEDKRDVGGLCAVLLPLCQTGRSLVSRCSRGTG